MPLPLTAARAIDHRRFPCGQRPWRGLFMAAIALLAILAWAPRAALAQDADPDAAPAPPADAGDPTRRVVVRFLTESDFPPFNFYDEDGVLVGLNVDVARAICLELNTACDIKVRPWGELLLALKRGEADAVIASHAVTPQTLAEVDFTDRYFHMPGRFAGKTGGEAVEMTPEGLEGKRIGVAKNTAHEAFIKAFFRSSAIRSYESTELARDALLQGEVDFVFDDHLFQCGPDVSFFHQDFVRHSAQFPGNQNVRNAFFRSLPDLFVGSLRQLRLRELERIGGNHVG